MGIFGRKRRSAATGDEVDADTTVDADMTVDADTTVDPDMTVDPDTTADTDTTVDDRDEADATDEPDEAEPELAFDRERGPFDRAEVEQDGTWLDLGALWVRAVDGMQLQLEVDQATQAVSTVQLSLDGSVAQLQAFAAPRTGALWPEIRTEIALTITTQGGSAQVVDGPLGRELAATLPRQGPHVRFLGVDGPRWFLRAVISGPAATDDAAAARLVDAVRGTVVVRGSEAMAPRELLPLRVPAAPAAAAPGQPEGTPDDLKPFERGPEITEVR